jgi:hypothetical protein
VSPVKYELEFLFQKMTFFIITSVKTSNLTKIKNYLYKREKKWSKGGNGMISFRC